MTVGGSESRYRVRRFETESRPCGLRPGIVFSIRCNKYKAQGANEFHFALTTEPRASRCTHTLHDVVAHRTPSTKRWAAASLVCATAIHREADSIARPARLTRALPQSWPRNVGFCGRSFSERRTLSISPYDTAWSGSRYFVRIESAVIFSSGCPVFSASSSLIALRALSTSVALILMSDACPRACERGCESMMEAFGRQARLPLTPLASNIAAVPNAVPMQIVSISGPT
mmetsp:Transcript_30101/g.98198  ORF Transcript_30101/g.98198 Transcript_30101/m.98198 type:complete len:230 (+) Transcript_30101:1501-2190(+)